MQSDHSIKGPSLRAKLIMSYLVILVTGGLATSLVGSWIVSSTIMAQARRAVEHHLATARSICEHQLQGLKSTVELAASGATISHHLSQGDTAAVLSYLDRVRKHNRFDFLTLTDRRGRVILRASYPECVGDDVSSLALVRHALSGEAVAAPEILSADRLEREDPRLLKRSYFRLVPTPRAKPIEQKEETSGMVLMSAAPLKGSNGESLGALYAGVLLNRNLDIVDQIWDLLYEGEQYNGKDMGSVTIFQGDLRISTTVKTETGERALATRVSEEVREAVLGNGRLWNDRAFVVNDWYISAYEPIRNYSGDIIGILYVGVLEKVYASTRNRVILWFFGLAAVGFILIISVTDYMIRNVTRPIGEMVTATRSIAAGCFNQVIRKTSNGEMALLAESFNTMLKSLRQMKMDLEEWAKTLEDKVKERTEELVAMQGRVAQSERLASLGMLAAGVAHEINNPLGGILSLTALTLEDLPHDAPQRGNLEEVVRQSDRCRKIVKGLLEFSRQSEEGTERVNVNETLEDTLALIGKQAAFFNVDIVKEFDPNVPPVTADRSQLQQAFMNIIVNAVQAMHEKGTLTL
ncbi:MAG: cache domain-containing protein, partial [Candidatus Krumholzibacteria bacterium]|nr:cache domain-containing protein [Candidatus Krumholzibacteria bacterium]